MERKIEVWHKRQTEVFIGTRKLLKLNRVSYFSLFLT